MTGALFAIAVILCYVALQGGIIFVTACLLRKATRRRFGFSKEKAIILSYFFWAFVLAGSVAIAGDGGSIVVWGEAVVGCITALVSAAIYLWLCQRHDTDATRKLM
jgi:membrane associated rhomboid family serine protease